MSAIVVSLWVDMEGVCVCERLAKVCPGGRLIHGTEEYDYCSVWTFLLPQLLNTLHAEMSAS